MKNKNINAFPGKEESAFGQDTGHYYGMTLRDYFAAKAMQSVMIGDGYRVYSTPEDLAQLSYLMADAMLKQRQE